MTDLLAIYQEPMFWKLPITTLVLSLVAFLVFALPWTWLAWKNPTWAQPYRIQDKPFEVERFFWPTLGRMLVNATIMLAVLFVTWPLIRQFGIHDGAIPPWWSIVLQLIFFTILDDFLYYWMHRAMHKVPTLRRAHLVHHRPRTPFALTGNYFHWFEFVATGSLVLVGPLLLSTHVYVVYIWIVFRQLQAADGHAGYDFGYWNPLHWIPRYQGPVYHDFHHAEGEGNYAGFLNHVDRWWKTYAPSYVTYTQRRQQGESVEQSRLK